MKLIYRLAFISLILFCSTEKSYGQSLKLSLPDVDWGIEAELSEFQIIEETISPQKFSARTFAKIESPEMAISIQLAKAPKKGDAKECRKIYWKTAKDSPTEKSDIKFSEKKDCAIVEYLVKEFQDIKLNQKNVNVYLSKNGYWIDVHISKVNYKDSDQKLFDEIIKKIKFFKKESIKSSNKPRTIKIANKGNLIFDVAVTWNQKLSQPANNLPPTIEFTAANPLDLQVFITPMWDFGNEDKSFNSPKELKSSAQENLKSMLPDAVEKKAELKELKGTDGVGYFFQVTDKNPKPNEYLVATSGLMAVDDLQLIVTILSQKKTSERVKSALRMIGKAKKEKL